MLGQDRHAPACRLEATQKSECAQNDNRATGDAVALGRQSDVGARLHACHNGMNLFDILVWHGKCYTTRQGRKHVGTATDTTAGPRARDSGIRIQQDAVNFLQAGFHPSPVFPRPQPGVFLYVKKRERGPP